MAYNPYSDIQKVFNAKVGWNNATTDEERKRQNEIANAARKNLEAYGYSDVANQISASGADATAARKVLEQYAPKPATVETNNLKSNEVNRENAGLFDKYNQSYEELTKTNPFTTDEAKAILGKYSLAGLQARDNAVASVGGSNGGNIDSYGAANAMRQQASLIGQGQSKVLEAHQQKIDNVRGLLSDMGVNIDRVFNQDETSKNNDVARKSEIASVTGYAPDEWVVSNNPYMNDDGTIKDQYKDIDFSAVMAKAKASGNTNAYNAAAVARYYKIMSDYGTLGKYDDGNYIVPGQQQTEAGRQFDEQNKTALATLGAESDLAKYEIDTKKTMADNENATNLSIAQTKANPSSNLTGSQATTALKNGEINETILKAYNDEYGTSYTLGNPPPVYDGSKSNTLADQWAKKLNDEISNKYGSGYTAINKTGTTFKRGNIDADYIILKILQSDELTEEEKEDLLDTFGISDSELRAVYNDKHYK